MLLVKPAAQAAQAASVLRVLGCKMINSDWAEEIKEPELSALPLAPRRKRDCWTYVTPLRPQQSLPACVRSKAGSN